MTEEVQTRSANCFLGKTAEEDGIPAVDDEICCRHDQQIKPRLGFVGVGWIGRNRMEAIASAGAAEICAVVEPSEEMAAKALQVAPTAEVLSSVEELLRSDCDGVVIATPSALHAAQAEAALRCGKAVFCQKPLGRNASEASRVVQAARETDLLLGVDLSYRFLSGVRKIRELCQSGELGRIYAVELVFHNAYGPDKAWFYDRNLSGGGCVMDLGIHLVDLALWTLGFPRVANVTSRLFSQGKPLMNASEEVEDYCEARLDLNTGATVRLACSWKLQAGCDALISGSFFGTRGGAFFSNVNGSFYDFKAERFKGTQRQTLEEQPENWGGRAVVHWAERLARTRRFDLETSQVVAVTEVLDAIYQNAQPSNLPPETE